MREEIKIKIWIRNAAICFLFILMIAMIGLFILKYNVEGEQNMPFKLSSMIVISSAEGYQVEQNKDYRWDAEIYQTNDIYLNIEKNKNYQEEEVIKKIIISHIQIHQPLIGTVEIYRPSANTVQAYHYEKEYQITDELELLGEKQTDIQNLKFSNQGGTILFRVLNKTGQRVLSNEESFEHNGKLLGKAGISYEDIQVQISFDLSILLESGKAYKGNIKLNLPIEDIRQTGSANLEIKNTKDIVFKREQI